MSLVSFFNVFRFEYFSHFSNVVEISNQETSEKHIKIEHIYLYLNFNFSIQKK